MSFVSLTLRPEVGVGTGRTTTSERPITSKRTSMDSQEASALPSILQRIADGESQAVDECLRRYGGLVWSLANRYCRSSSDAEDLVQEIFVEIWRHSDRYDPERASETTFISMIARRRLIDRSRREQASPDWVSIGDSLPEVPDEDAVDSVELSDEAAKAVNCMRKLSDVQQKVLTLSIDYGHAQTAISDALKMPLGTVKSYARRGLLQLRECMNRPLGAEAAS